MMTGDVINDEDWCCSVVLMAEDDPRFTPVIDQFERNVSSCKDYPIVNIRPKDLTTLRNRQNQWNKTTPRGSKREANFDDSLVGLLKSIILKRKVEDLLEWRMVMLGGDTRDPAQYVGMPKCGPFCYFVLTKFYNPALPLEIIKAGIPLVGILEVGDEITITRNKVDATYSSGQMPKAQQLNRFWIQLIENLGRRSNYEMFSNTLLIPINISEIPIAAFEESSKKKGEVIFEYIKSCLFTLTQNMRNYIHFMNNMKIQDVPILPEGYKPQMDIYEALIGGMPLHCVTIELMLNCMVEQVSAIVDLGENDYKCLLSSISKTHKNDSQFPRTVFINHNDFILKKCYRVSNELINLKDLHTKIYLQMPYVKVWNLFPEQTEVEKVMAANQLQKLQRCTDNCLQKKEFINCLHLLFFNKMYNIISSLEGTATTETPGSMVTSATHFQYTALEESASNSVGEQDESVEVELAERERQLKYLNDFLKCDEVGDLMSLKDEEELFSHYYSEDLREDLLIQALQKSYNRFSCLDYEYSRLTDSLLLWFHNDNDESGLFTDDKQGILLTPVGFRDFYINFSGKESAWFAGEKENMSLVENELRNSYVNRLFPDGSIATNITDTLEFQVPFPKKTLFREDVHAEPHKIGYTIDASSSVVKNGEIIKKFYSVDGPILTVKKHKWLKKSEFVTVALNSHGHLINFHKKIETFDDSECELAEDNGVYFLLQTKKGTIISCKRNKSRNFRSSAVSFISRVGEAAIDTNILDVTISLPNGLMIYFVRGEDFYYIKQQYINPPEECRGEDYRIFLPNGIVMVFMKNGSIVVLYPNTTETRIKSLRKINPYCPSDDEYEEQVSKHVKITKVKVPTNSAEEERNVIVQVYRHEVICPNGEFVRFSGGKRILKEQAYHVRAAANPSKGLYTVRTDGMKQFVNTNGDSTTMFADDTVILSKPHLDSEWVVIDQWSFDCQSNVGKEEPSTGDYFVQYSLKYTMYHPSYSKVEHTSGTWTVHLPHGVKLTNRHGASLQVNFDEDTILESTNEILSITSNNIVNKIRETKTFMFLETSEVYEEAICSITDSDSKAFYVTKSGTTRVFNGMNELTKHSSVFLGRVDSTTESLRRAESLLDFRKSRIEEMSSLLYSNLYYKSHTIKPVEDVKLFMLRGEIMKRTSPYLRHKQRNRYFVIKRDLSGCEFINEKDNEITLQTYEDEDTDEFRSKHSSICTKSYYTWSQKLIKGSRKRHRLSDPVYEGIFRSGFKKYELSQFLPADKNWLLDLSESKHNISQGDTKCSLSVKVRPIQGHCPFIIRRVYNNKQNIKSIMNMFECAFNKYNKINDEIIQKYRDHVIPDKRSQQEIQELCDTFEQGRKYIFDNMESFSIDLTKTDISESSTQQEYNSKSF